jgi:hypothetical protein
LKDRVNIYTFIFECPWIERCGDPTTYHSSELISLPPGSSWA